MSRFWIQFLVLLVFIVIVSNVFSGLIIEIKQTAIGFALLTTFWMALGWYWGRIYDYCEIKIRSLLQK